MPSSSRNRDSRPATPDCVAVDGQLRRALLSVLENSPPPVAFGPLLGALATIAHDRVDRLAWEMAEAALVALVHKSPAARDAVVAWHAHRRGARSATSDALAILDVAAAVDHAAYLYHRREEWLESKGRVAVEQLRGHLLERLGRGIPDLDNLEDWIRRHSPRKARGRLTTAGIVAKIVHRGRLLGARGVCQRV